MNISRTNITDLNAVLTLQITKSDYDTRLENTLRDVRKKVALKGFRQGKVPMGVINKMYGKQALLDELNKLISESLDGYIKEEKLSLLGEPLPYKTEKHNNLDVDTEFEFAFEIGLSPKFEINLSEIGEIEYFNISPDEKIVNDHIENMRRQSGKDVQLDLVENLDERLTVDFEELDENGVALENGIKSQDAFILLSTITKEESKNLFTGVVPNQVLTINPKEVFENENDVALMLKIEKEKIADLNSKFNMTIKSIARFTPAELNSDFYKQIYPSETIETIDDFKKKVSETIAEEFSKSSMYKFSLDSRDKLMNHMNIELPTDFLKRWISQTNEKITKEQLETEFPHFITDFKWQLIRDKIFADNDIVLEETELETIAAEEMQNQFRRYGLNLPLENVIIYAKEALKKKEERRKYENILVDNKVAEVIKNAVSVIQKTVSIEEFNSLFKKHEETNDAEVVETTKSEE